VSLRRELLRAHMTRRVGHGVRYTATRAYFSDGTIEERVNPGKPDEGELPWKRIGRYDDLAAERDRLRRQGWQIERRRARA
jgi:hypothetical protein